MGYASALAWMLFLIVLALTCVQFRARDALGLLRGRGALMSAGRAGRDPARDAAAARRGRRSARRAVYAARARRSALLFLFPFIWMVSTSLKTAPEICPLPAELLPEPLRWSNYSEALTRVPFGRWLREQPLVRRWRSIGARARPRWSPTASRGCASRGRDAALPAPARDDDAAGEVTLDPALPALQAARLARHATCR